MTSWGQGNGDRAASLEEGLTLSKVMGTEAGGMCLDWEGWAAGGCRLEGLEAREAG